MSNPWLEIPLEEYEGHMSLPSIGQAQMLADHFEEVLWRHRPRSVGIIGCAGGNGLERIVPGSVDRVVAVDINPGYVERARVRHAARLDGLHCYCADVQSDALQFEPVELIYAALLFEYVDMRSTLMTLKRNCRSGGALATVLQLPSADQHAVSQSPYRSVSLLAPAIRLAAPEELRGQAAAAGFADAGSESMVLASGKRFIFQDFRG